MSWPKAALCGFQSLLTIFPGILMIVDPDSFAENMVTTTPDAFAIDLLRLYGMLLFVIGLFAVRQAWHLLQEATLGSYAYVHVIYSALALCLYKHFSAKAYWKEGTTLPGMALSALFFVTFLIVAIIEMCTGERKKND
jgi:hypothetical protein